MIPFQAFPFKYKLRFSLLTFLTHCCMKVSISNISWWRVREA